MRLYCTEGEPNKSARYHPMKLDDDEHTFTRGTRASGNIITFMLSCKNCGLKVSMTRMGEVEE